MKAFDAAGIDEVIVVPLFIAQESTRMNTHLQSLTGMKSESKTSSSCRTKVSRSTTPGHGSA